MAYLRTREEPWTLSGLGCGPDCKCGPCRGKFAGFSEQYIPADDDEEMEPEQAPPESQPPPDTAPEPSPEPTPQPESSKEASAGHAPISAHMRRGPRASRRGRPAPRLGGYFLGNGMPTLGGLGRFWGARYSAPFGYYGVFAQVPAEQGPLREALRRGERDPNKLTDMLFYARHPERHGSRLRREEAELILEW